MRYYWSSANAFNTNIRWERSFKVHLGDMLTWLLYMSVILIVLPFWREKITWTVICATLQKMWGINDISLNADYSLLNLATESTLDSHPPNYNICDKWRGSNYNFNIQSQWKKSCGNSSLNNSGLQRFSVDSKKDSKFGILFFWSGMGHFPQNIA